MDRIKHCPHSECTNTSHFEIINSVQLENPGCDIVFCKECKTEHAVEQKSFGEGSVGSFKGTNKQPTKHEVSLHKLISCNNRSVVARASFDPFVGSDNDFSIKCSVCKKAMDTFQKLYGIHPTFGTLTHTECLETFASIENFAK